MKMEHCTSKRFLFHVDFKYIYKAVIRSYKKFHNFFRYRTQGPASREDPPSLFEDFFRFIRFGYLCKVSVIINLCEHEVN